MNCKKKLKMFPWMGHINKLVYKSCFSRTPNICAGTFQELYHEVSSEIRNISLQEDFGRAEKLYEVLSGYYIFFHMSNITFDEEHGVPHDSFIMLMSCLVDLYIFLCHGDSSSLHLENCIRDLFLFTRSSLHSLWDVLLCCKLLKRKHSALVIPIIKCAMRQLPKTIGDPMNYMKMIVLMRRWKVFLDSKEDKHEIVSSALKVAPPDDILHWLSTLDIEGLENLPDSTKKLANHLLRKKFPKGFFQQVQVVLCKNVGDVPNGDDLDHCKGDSASDKFFIDKTLSSTGGNVEPEGLLVDVSGLGSFGEVHLEEPELSDVEVETRKKKSKKNKRRVKCDDSHNDASDAVSRGGFFIDPTGQNDCEEDQFEEQEFPGSGAEKTTKKKKRKGKIKKPSEADQANAIMDEPIEDEMCAVGKSEITAYSECSNEKPPHTKSLSKKLKTGKLGNKEYMGNNESVENQLKQIEILNENLDIAQSSGSAEGQKKKRKRKKFVESENEMNQDLALESDSLIGEPANGAHREPAEKAKILTENLGTVQSSGSEGQKKKKKKRRKKMVESENEINGDLALKSGSLIGEPASGMHGKHVKKATKSSNKTVYMSVDFGDAICEPSSLVNTELVMDTESTSESQELPLFMFSNDKEKLSHRKKDVSISQSVDVSEVTPKDKRKRHISLASNLGNSESCERSKLEEDDDVEGLQREEVTLLSSQKYTKRESATRVSEVQSSFVFTSLDDSNSLLNLQDEENMDVAPTVEMNEEEQIKLFISPGGSDIHCKEGKLSHRKEKSVSVSPSSDVSEITPTRKEKKRNSLVSNLSVDESCEKSLSNMENLQSEDQKITPSSYQKSSKKERSAEKPSVASISSLEYYNAPLNLQSEESVDIAPSTGRSEDEETKLLISPDNSSFQLVSPSDKEGKLSHKKKAKKHRSVASVVDGDESCEKSKSLEGDVEGRQSGDLETTPLTSNKSARKGKNAKKHSFTSNSLEDSNLQLNLQSEESVDIAPSIGRSEETKLLISPDNNSFQLVSPSDKEGKLSHKKKAKKHSSVTSVVDGDESCEKNKSLEGDDLEGRQSEDLETTPLTSKKSAKKGKNAKKHSFASNSLEDSNLLLNLQNKESLDIAPAVERSEEEESKLFISPDVISSSDKRGKLSHKKNEGILILQASDVSEVTPKRKLKKHSSVASNLGDETCEKGKSSLEEDIMEDFQSDGLKVTPLSHTSARKEGSGKKDFRTPCPPSFVYDSLKKECMSPKESACDEIVNDNEDMEVKNEHDNLSELSFVSISHSESKKSRKRRKKEFVDEASFGTVSNEENSDTSGRKKKKKRDLSYDCRKSLSLSFQNMEEEEDKHLPCSSGISGDGSTVLNLGNDGTPDSAQKKKNDSYLDQSLSLNSVCIKNEENGNGPCELSDGIRNEENKVSVDSSKSPAFCREKNDKNVVKEERERFVPQSNENCGDEIRVKNVIGEESFERRQRRKDMSSSGHNENFLTGSAPCVTEVKSEGETSGSEMKVLNGNTPNVSSCSRRKSSSHSKLGTNMKTERTEHCDSLSGVKTRRAKSFVACTSDATNPFSSDESDDNYHVMALSQKYVGTRKKLQKRQINDVESDIFSLGKMLSKTDSNSPPVNHASPNRGNLQSKSASSQNQFSKLADNAQLQQPSDSQTHHDSDDICSILNMPQSSGKTLKSPKTESDNIVLNSIFTDDSLAKTKTLVTDKSNEEQLFSESSSDSETFINVSLLSRITHKRAYSGNSIGILGAKEKMSMFPDGKEPPLKDFTLYLDTSSGDEESTPEVTSKDHDHPKAGITSNSSFSQCTEKLESSKDAEDGDIIVLDSDKDSATDVTDLDLLASLESKKESLICVPDAATDAKNIQCRHDEMPPCLPERSASEETVRNVSLPTTGDCDYNADNNCSEKCYEIPSCGSAVQVSPLKECFEKAEMLSNTMCTFTVPGILFTQHSDTDDMLISQKVPESDKNRASQTSQQGSKLDDLMSFSSPACLNSTRELFSNQNSIKSSVDSHKVCRTSERRKSPGSTSLHKSIPSGDRSPMDYNNNIKRSCSASPSDKDSSSSCTPSCGQMESKQKGNCISPLHYTSPKEQLNCEANNTTVSKSRDSPPSLRKISSSGESLPCADVGNDLTKEPPSVFRSPSLPRQSSIVLRKHSDTSLLCELKGDLAVGEKENVLKTSLEKKNLATSPLQKSPGIKSPPVLRSAREKQLSNVDKSSSALASSSTSSKVLQEEPLCSSPLRHSSRLKQKWLSQFFAKKQLSVTSPSKIFLSESNSMMDSKNHLDFSDLRTSPQKSPARNKNVSSTLKRKESDSTKDLDKESDTRLSVESSPSKDKSPVSPWKFRLRAPSEDGSEKSSTSSGSFVSPNVPEPSNSHCSNEGNPESPTRNHTRNSGQLVSSEPVQSTVSSEPVQSARKKAPLSSESTAMLNQTLGELCLTPSSRLPENLSYKSPNQTLPESSDFEHTSESPINTSVLPVGAETECRTIDDDAIPSTSKYTPMITDSVKKNLPKSINDAVSSSASRIRTRQASISGTNKKTNESYNLRPRKSLILPSKLDLN